MNTARRDELPDRITGATLHDVELIGDQLVRLSFRHRGTDDDACWLVVPADAIRFEDDDE